MTNSVKLLRKDISIIFKISKMNFFVFVYPICMSCVIITSNLAVSIPIIMTATAYAVYAIVVGLITTEEKTKSSMIFQSLPLNKLSIVLGKYMFAVVVIFVASLLSSIFPAVKSIMSKDISIVGLSFLNSFMFSIMLLSIFFPFYYKMGYLKMQTINMVIFFSLVIASTFINLLKNAIAIKPVIDIIYIVINFVMLNSITAFIGCMSLYLISMMISFSIEKNK